MAERTLFPHWREENEGTKYPFAASATLTNGTAFLLEGTLLDACLYPVGGREGLYLSRVDVTSETVTVWIGDAAMPQRASGVWPVTDPPDRVALRDTFNRPAGILVSEPIRLALLAGWGVGTHAFTAAQAGFAATVCLPTPQAGLRGVRLEDGTVLTGDVWLVGTDGVVVRREDTAMGGPCSRATVYPTLRIDVVGDPLFVRKLCGPAGTLFRTPNLLRKVVFKDRRSSVTVTPDEYGDIKLVAGNSLTDKPVLRIRATPDGTVVEAVGSTLQGIVN